MKAIMIRIIGLIAILVMVGCTIQQMPPKKYQLIKLEDDRVVCYSVYADTGFGQLSVDCMLKKDLD